MTLNVEKEGFMGFLAISGCDTNLSFTRWRHRTVVMRSRQFGICIL